MPTASLVSRDQLARKVRSPPAIQALRTAAIRPYNSVQSECGAGHRGAFSLRLCI